MRLTVRDGRFECARHPVIVLFRFQVKPNDCHDFQFLLSDSASGRQICEYLSDLNSNSIFFAAIPIKNNRIRFCRENHLNLKKKKRFGARAERRRGQHLPDAAFSAQPQKSFVRLSPPPLLPHKQYIERGRLCVIPPTLPPSRCTLYQFYLYLLVVERRLDVAAVVVVVSVQHSPTPCCVLTQGQLFSK